MHHYSSAILRYPALHQASTALDVYSDVLTYVRYLTSRSYVEELLVKSHGVAPADAPGRARQILPHIRLGLTFVEQAREANGVTSFLPGYYSILNLAKAMILASPRFADLSTNRRHGSGYAGLYKRSQSPLTDTIDLYPGGALPLLYAVLTGTPVPVMNGKKKMRIPMVVAYSSLQDIAAEYQLASGRFSTMAHVYLDAIKVGGQFMPRAVVLCNPQVMNRVDRLSICPSYVRLQPQPGLALGWTPPGVDPMHVHIYQGDPIPNGADLFTEMRQAIRPHLLYTPISVTPTARPFVMGFCPLRKGRLQLPEEFPIALSFFHLSSVVRYNPEFVEQLEESRYWPMLLSLKTNGILRFLTLFWSYFHKQSILLQPR